MFTADVNLPGSTKSSTRTIAAIYSVTRLVGDNRDPRMVNMERAEVAGELEWNV